MTNESGRKKDRNRTEETMIVIGILAMLVIGGVIYVVHGTGGSGGSANAGADTKQQASVPKNGHYEDGVPVLEDEREFWCEKKFQGQCDSGMFQGSDMERVQQVACVDWTDRMSGARSSACYRNLNDCNYKRTVDDNVSQPTLCTVVRYKPPVGSGSDPWKAVQ